MDEKERLGFGQWFKELTKMTLWLFLMVITIFGFYQVLPMFLLFTGQALGLLGTVDVAPTIVDALVFVPTAMSITLVLTYGFYLVLRSEWRAFNRTSNRLTDDLVERLNSTKEKLSKSKWFGKK